MNSLFGKGDITIFLLCRTTEKSIRAQVSEATTLKLHDEVYTPIKRIKGSIRNQFIGAGTGTSEFVPFRPYDKERLAITELQRLLNSNAKERELQSKLVDSGLLNVTCKIAQEVTLAPKHGSRGMRMDIIVEPKNTDAHEIVELKRGSHLLLARQGKPSERLSEELKRAVSQIKNYANRVEIDNEVAVDIELRHGIKIQSPELRLVAGRRLSDATGYLLLSKQEADVREDYNLHLQIYTWDGFLAELERILG